jgi:hypothetical protein
MQQNKMEKKRTENTEVAHHSTTELAQQTL